MVVFNVRVSSWAALYEVVGWDGLVLLFLHLRDAIGDTRRLLLDRVKRSKFRLRLKDQSRPFCEQFREANPSRFLVHFVTLTNDVPCSERLLT